MPLSNQDHVFITDVLAPGGPGPRPWGKIVVQIPLRLGIAIGSIEAQAKLVAINAGVQKWPDIVRLRDAGKLNLQACDCDIPHSESPLTKIHSGEHGSLILRAVLYRRKICRLSSSQKPYINGYPDSNAIGFVQPTRIQVNLLKPDFALALTWRSASFPTSKLKVVGNTTDGWKIVASHTCTGGV